MAAHESPKMVCPYCQQPVIKRGVSAVGAQRYYCKSCRKTCQREYRSNAWKPGVHELISQLLLNGSGVREIARRLKVSTDTVSAIRRHHQPPSESSEKR